MLDLARGLHTKSNLLFRDVVARLNGRTGHHGLVSRAAEVKVHSDRGHWRGVAGLLLKAADCASVGNHLI